MGEDTDREGLERTPNRAAKALQFFTSGYCQSVSDVIGEGIFNEETSSDMVMVKNIDIHSLCEHHMVPFSGRVTIAYIPQGKILGLSKLARIANLFARRLQVQERLTRQIANAVMEAISPLGVGVTIEATYVPVLSYLFLLPRTYISCLFYSGFTCELCRRTLLYIQCSTSNLFFCVTMWNIRIRSSHCVVSSLHLFYVLKIQFSTYQTHVHGDERGRESRKQHCHKHLTGHIRNRQTD